MENLLDNLIKIYGNIKLSRIYDCKDGRKRIDVIFENHRKTFQLAKLKLEAYIGRKLIDDETVDHIDGDRTNDSIENLRVLSLSDNAKDSVKRLLPIDCICMMCNVKFTLNSERQRNVIKNVNKRKAGPFCSKSCAGKYGAEIQNGRIGRLPTLKINSAYTTNKERASGGMAYTLGLDPNAERIDGSNPS